MRILPCPCCASTKIHQGYAHSLAMGVQCLTCGLKMEREFPYLWPKGLKFVAGAKGWTILEKRTLKRAITAWNKRVK